MKQTSHNDWPPIKDGASKVYKFFPKATVTVIFNCYRLFLNVRSNVSGACTNNSGSYTLTKTLQ